MPTWRCPHCGTPQAETSRCWVCKRSSTSCGTCRHFRRSVAVQVAYCGLDPRRAPLRGDEIRGCWEERPPVSPTAPTSEPRPAGPSRREFVLLDRAATTPGATPDPAEIGPAALAVAPTLDAGLWGDLEG